MLISATLYSRCLSPLTATRKTRQVGPAAMYVEVEGEDASRGVSSASSGDKMRVLELTETLRCKVPGETLSPQLCKKTLSDQCSNAF